MDLSFTAEEEAFAREVRDWLAANAEPAPRFATIADEVEYGRRWQARLAADRWVGIHWPREYGGRGATPVEVALFNMEYARSRALQPINRVGINLAGPTLLVHGTEAQKARWLPTILTAEEIWCQLFSEPDAGSDLASLQTRAERVDGGWRLTGQKVWTSYAQFARWGICLARTNAEAPKHRGLSYLIVDMQAPGVEIRPLVQITGDAEFNEVFFDGAFVSDDHLVGPLDGGWAVANTTLAHERGTAFPFKEQVVHEVLLDECWRTARDLDRLDAAEVADALAESFVELRVLRLLNWKTLSRLTKGIEPGPESSITKLVWTDMSQALAARALDMLGPAAPLWWDATDNPGGGTWQRQWLWSKAASIAGGTSEVQRTIIGERMLGLPREPSSSGGRR